MIGVFDRSHYEDVLIARVHGLAAPEVIEQRYGQISAFERELVASGTAIVKVMLHISRDEQKKRLARRLDRRDKQWKYNPQDVDERARWDDYMAAYQRAIRRTTTPDGALVRRAGRPQVVRALGGADDRARTRCAASTRSGRPCRTTWTRRRHGSPRADAVSAPLGTNQSARAR